jgi:transcription termination/antitermination protein NusG
MDSTKPTASSRTDSGARSLGKRSSWRLIVEDRASGDYLSVSNGADARAFGDWYAVRVRSNRERKVLAGLTGRGVAVYLPTYRERVQYSDREKDVERVLFPGYVFVRTPGHPGAVLTLSGVIGLLPNNMNPTVIDPQEIETIRTVTTATASARPAPIAVGETVRVNAGPMAGQTGVVERSKSGGARLIVNLEWLNRAVSVEVSAGDVETAKAAAAA